MSVPELIIDANSSGRSSLRELLAYRELGFALAQRDLRVRYQDTLLGAAWAVLQPLANMVIFSLILGRLGKLPSAGVPYPVFVFAGLLAWFLFANSVTQISQSVPMAAALIKKVYFPRLLIPLSAMAVSVLDFLVSALLMLGLMAFYAMAPSASVLLVPVLVLGIVLLALGSGLLLASLSVSYRDFRFVIPFMLQIWMFLTPVVYSLELIPERWRLFVFVNPMAGFVEAFRAAWLGREIPLSGLLISCAVALAVFVLGLHAFRRVENRLADEL